MENKPNYIKLETKIRGIVGGIGIVAAGIAIIWGGYVTFYKGPKIFENSNKQIKQAFVDMKKEHKKYDAGARWSTENLLPPEEYEKQEKDIQRYSNIPISNNPMIGFIVKEATKKGLVEIVEK